METWKEHIKAHSLRCAPHEACGMLIPEPQNGFTALESPNTCSDPTQGFEIAPEAFLSGLRAGVTALYHSHPTTGPIFSPADRSVAENLRLPLWLYCAGTDSFHCYTPSGYAVPLENRSFVLGTHDCVGLVMDYYASVLALKISDFRRVISYVDTGWNELPAYLRQNSFFVVDSPKEGDIVLMRLGRAKFVNHCGIYLDGDILLHQLINRRSGRVIYKGYWERVTSQIIRHKTRL